MEVTPTTLTTFFSCSRQSWPITLTSELDLDNVNSNQPAKYLGQRSFNSKVIVRIHWQTHIRPIAFPGPLKWLIIIQYKIQRNASLVIKILLKDSSLKTKTVHQYVYYRSRSKVYIQHRHEELLILLNYTLTKSKISGNIDSSGIVRNEETFSLATSLRGWYISSKYKHLSLFAAEYWLDSLSPHRYRFINIKQHRTQ